MIALFTQCPYCHTSYRVSEDQLDAAEGYARCGNCLQVFSVTECEIQLNKENRITQDIPININPPTTPDPLLEPPAVEPETEPELPIKLHIIDQSHPYDEDEINSSILNSSVDTGQTGFHQHLTDLDDNPSLSKISLQNIAAINDAPNPIGQPLTKRPIHLPFHKIALGCCSIFLLLILASQFLWHNNDSLILNARFKPLISTVCSIVSCRQDNQIELAKLHTQALDVRSHPNIANALQVSFIFLNQANFAQPLPLAELSFSDINNRLLINRLFTPEEYLPVQLRHYTHLPVNASIQVSLDLLDPGADATNYSLVFRAP